MALTQPPAVLSAGRGAPRPEPPARAYACPLPLVPARARGLTVETADGRRYLDCFPGGGALVLGHHHPVVREAVRSALARGVPPAEVFADELRATLPGRLADHARLHFCPPTRAAALAAARALAAGAGGFVEIVRDGEGANGSRRMGTGDGGTCGDAGVEGFARACDLAADRAVAGGPGVAPGGDGGGDHPDRDAAAARVLGGGGLAGAVPGRGVGAPASSHAEGPGPAGTVPGARDRTLLVADETRTGPGRTGAFWDVQHTGRVPDVMVLAGAIGGGLPLALLVHGADVPAALPERDAHGNRLAMAAGAATLRHIRDNGLAPRAAALGARMLARLRRAVAGRDPVTGVHGRGLLLGVTCADATAAEAVRRACLRRGLLVGADDDEPRLLRLLPPLTLTDEQAEAVLDRFTDAVGAVSGGSRAGVPVAVAAARSGLPAAPPAPAPAPARATSTAPTGTVPGAPERRGLAAVTPTAADVAAAGAPTPVLEASGRRGPCPVATAVADPVAVGAATSARGASGRRGPRPVTTPVADPVAVGAVTPARGASDRLGPRPLTTPVADPVAAGAATPARGASDRRGPRPVATAVTDPVAGGTTTAGPGEVSGEHDAPLREAAETFAPSAPAGTAPDAHGGPVPEGKEVPPGSARRAAVPGLSAGSRKPATPRKEAGAAPA
ncbi:MULTISPECIES: aminotransferase class III-fold pyridoxal phosphate-dependent enzyme [Streptomyces]|uniref:aminotransferase class III-fold pyridoxal phosphate-dependent enzyme n=1 Tax=Streptomyces TaxID=1883 RepID=UPI00163B6B0D|nr:MULTISPECIES: aminotransferase class III-fold pyridoxal phosphate-dependent enzyme [Streptomyces]MBC2876793.1 aminotransferase class III-fold pyridoxal phosphate-dependent enzyme [Streptomyces sp. TYQ1024]UBI36417.1 aminotransferase class III-fold pyridoxal phosphate-dependent enzyme [Streptomyces mobaraensis]UKW29009.1 aminotransferase class III-fold pyridoxal phosphate-dependent enzyme [Streptomyces sp. TYQ1024]